MGGHRHCLPGFGGDATTVSSVSFIDLESTSDRLLPEERRKYHNHRLHVCYPLGLEDVGRNVNEGCTTVTSCQPFSLEDEDKSSGRPGL